MVEPLRYYLDESVSAALAGHLRTRGIDTLAALDAGLAGIGIEDDKQFRFAQEQGRILVTRDYDFIALAARYPGHAGVLLLHRPLSVGETLEYLELTAHMLTASEMRDRVVFCDW